jgi:hypothetical protein
MFDAVVFSFLFLFLSGAFLICVAGTFMPLFLGQSNIGDLWPVVYKAARLSITMTGICIVMILLSSAPLIRNATVEGATAGMFIWSWIVMALLKMRKKTLDKQETASDRQA